jgi:23S rRNA pseudouridine1911/1915/1917 synthase
MPNDGHEYREQIGPQAEGRSVLGYLAESYRHSSAEAWRRRIEEGRVLLDSKPVRENTVLRPGQWLVWRRPPWREPGAPRSFAILYKDADLLAAAKPAGLPTLPGAGFLENTLQHRVRSVEPDATPLHRLGRFTSGVVLFARTREARAGLTSQWVAREVLKRYRARAVGSPGAGKRFDVDTPIGPVPHPLLGTVHAASPAGKPAASRVRVIEQGERDFVCDVEIVTGRPHQVRIHLAAAGHPLVGDPLYPPGGVPASDCRALPGDPGYRLHARELSFRHPRTGARLTIVCEAPPDLRPTLERVDG